MTNKKTIISFTAILTYLVFANLSFTQALSCTVTSCTDSDGDKYTPDTTCNIDPACASCKCGDCNDLNPTVYDGAPELCDGLDTDCDGAVPDEEKDHDGDGHVECNPNGLTQILGNDCNDLNPTVYDGAPELCDGLDNDCDGAVPDEEKDHDGDGYVECNPNGLTQMRGNDCNDSDRTIYPGAPEICDGKINSCGGILPPREADRDHDGYIECNSNGKVPDNDCNDDDPTITPIGPEICDGKVNICGDILSPQESDRDHDGYIECNSNGKVPDNDCNDDDPTITPIGPEICDGKVNICGDILQPWEYDTDHDKFMVCQNDCNDNDPSINPNATEICNDNLDNDCDNYIDCSDSDCNQDPVCTGIPEYPSILLAPILTIISIAILRQHIF